MRVLYVEDSLADQELTRRHLERRAPRIKLTVASTVADALRALTAGGADVVLSDYRLPDGTGLELVELIKQGGWLVPVVLVTGSGDPETAVRLLKAGAADYVVKRSGYLETLPAVLEGAFRWFDSLRDLRQGVVRILYADHDLADAELTVRAFREHGGEFTLEIAHTADELAGRLGAASYDLLLLDSRLPDRSGLEALKWLRAERIDIPVVMLTGQGDEDTAVQAFKLGAADYIVKHAGYAAKLPATVEAVLARRRLADEKDALLRLSGLTTSLAALRDAGELARQVAATAASVLRTEQAVLWLRAGAALRPASAVGLPLDTVPPLAPPPAGPDAPDGIPGRRLALSTLVPAPGATAEPGALGQPDRALAISLVDQAGVVGALAVASRGPRRFSGTDERLLTILADHTAVAVENLRLYEQLSARLDELRRTQAQLVQTEKLAAMGQLLAGVAHELNNPLSVVLGQALLLRKNAADEQLARRTGQIALAAERCARIVRNFLALARQRPPARAAVDLNRVVQEALELLAYSLRVDGVAVELALAADLPPLWADPHQLHQVVLNLATNAQHAMRDAAPPRRLRVTSAHDVSSRRVTLEVADSGPGIPPAIRDRIFEPFFTTKPPGQGTGLGLSLCHGIVERHGGTIQVADAPGPGAAFRIVLPVQAPPPSGLEAAPAGAARRRSLAILVVDDEPEVAATLADVLAGAGHRVETAGDGRVALARIEARHYDVVVSDVKMPELDGPGLHRALALRASPLLRRLVFLTGDALSTDLAEFLRRSGNAHLEKPFTPEEVLAVVERVIS
jgi:two-component system NtrC family sensor kinase